MAIARGTCADPETQLEVDEMVLDYLLYMSTKSLLDEHMAQRSGQLSQTRERQHSISNLLLGMVDDFLFIFKTHHPTYQPHTSLQCRLRLLKYTTLFARRLYSSPAAPPLSSLEKLRRKNHKRATRWLHHRAGSSTLDCSSLSIFSTTLPLSESALQRKRRQLLSAMSVSDPIPFYGTPASPSLLDSFPIFMALSSIVAPTASITVAWMAIAGELMLQATLEQYLVYGAQGPAAVTEAFAWGYDAREEVVGGEQGDINAMFWDEGVGPNAMGGEVEAWARLREDYMKTLMPDVGVDLVAHLEALSTRFPLGSFEEKIIDFLQALLASQPRPILTQLESGKLQGFSKEETAALKLKVGIS